MEYIFFAVIFYFIMQAASNLVVIMRGQHGTPIEEDRSHGWQGPSPRQYTGSERGSVRYWDDVRDAQWKDVSD
ncbi:hypothetical protein CRI94_06680 [Longibacter salinarum]|uniref:Uncharacterized protein n=2 Tax=Longibacter salinarum TaxID=1850348 RepID=A0A2A8CYS4_9BACT|nr:hypothetical protein CRI94_06680 [Longibacter salinarum]